MFGYSLSNENLYSLRIENIGVFYGVCLEYYPRMSLIFVNKWLLNFFKNIFLKIFPSLESLEFLSDFAHKIEIRQLDEDKILKPFLYVSQVFVCTKENSTLKVKDGMMAVISDANVKTRALEDTSVLICKYFGISQFWVWLSDIFSYCILYNLMLSNCLEVMFYYLCIVHILVTHKLHVPAIHKMLQYTLWYEIVLELCGLLTFYYPCQGCL